MCRGKQFCSELGIDPSAWDKNCPLRVPSEYDNAVDLFAGAILLFAKGKRDECISKIEEIDNVGITNWYVEHGQMSGFYRNKIIGINPGNKLPIADRYPVRSPARLQDKVFERDGYRCRYCGNKLISQHILKEFAKKLNSPSFTKGSTNLTSHAVIHLTWPAADHVVPWSYGGTTTLDNLVASCAPCNYGKADFTLEQIGISDPFSRKPFIDEWNGLKFMTQY